eukprot:TRINITY_DN2037_c0_g1_i2.p1 TRINITY_DN2037_c0_g1~~TRINITY_DN2037_c0_g1_i2.p1  ORF type:complete len:297 (+),score=45.83 TRINITY_DN2037_c0_g1_i2:586-1476(+)
MFFNDRYDADTKRSKWKADVMQNIGTGIDLCTTIFPSLFLPLASLSNVIKGIAGLTKGATKASVNRHFSQHQNMGDITAKTYIQGLVGYLLGMGITVLLTTFTPVLDVPWMIWSCYFVFGGIHLGSGYLALSNLKFKSLNEQRTWILLDNFFTTGEIYTPSELNSSKKECIVLKSPSRIQPLINMNGKIDTIKCENLVDMIEQHPSHKFQIIISDELDNINIFLHEQAEDIDIVEAYFTAIQIQRKLINKLYSEDIVEQCLTNTKKLFKTFCETAEKQGWNLGKNTVTNCKYRINW